uniref:cytochrome c oxidase subunit 2 n=1 Tax=Lingula reevii TaxID=2792136 RepID=UPI002E789482|nr:cytochrome c oxidase subunit 2 [Lingula reevii]WQG15350.1 cytochrome c oxidase subunit 2 [Lingula reevii]
MKPMSSSAALSQWLFEFIMTVNCGVFSIVLSSFVMAVSCGHLVGHCRKWVKYELLEWTWTVIPALLVAWIASASFYVLYANGEHKEPTLFHSVITGHQWYWSYKYGKVTDGEFKGFEHDSYGLLLDAPDGEADVTSLERGDMYLMSVDAPFVMPCKVPGELLVTSDDVIHSWSVPALGLTIDAVPGRLNRSSIYATTPGVAYGHCRELCGVNHHAMPIVVEIISASTYLKFLDTE